MMSTSISFMETSLNPVARHGRVREKGEVSFFGQVDSSLARKHEGAGLGLPLAKGLIEAHGGEFRIASVKGKGTRAGFRLPPGRLADGAADASLADGDIPR